MASLQTLRSWPSSSWCMQNWRHVHLWHVCACLPYMHGLPETSAERIGTFGVDDDMQFAVAVSPGLAFTLCCCGVSAIVHIEPEATEASLRWSELIISVTCASILTVSFSGKSPYSSKSVPASSHVCRTPLALSSAIFLASFLFIFSVPTFRMHPTRRTASSYVEAGAVSERTNRRSEYTEWCSYSCFVLPIPHALNVAMQLAKVPRHTSLVRVWELTVILARNVDQEAITLANDWHMHRIGVDD